MHKLAGMHKQLAHSIHQLARMHKQLEPAHLAATRARKFRLDNEITKRPSVCFHLDGFVAVAKHFNLDELPWLQSWHETALGEVIETVDDEAATLTCIFMVHIPVACHCRAEGSL